MGIRYFLKTLKNIDSIQCLIEENYTYIKGYISKWFSVLEVSREVMDYEQKITFQNGNIVKDEYGYWYYATVTPLHKKVITEFTNNKVIEKHYNNRGELDRTTTLTTEEFWKKHFDYDINIIYGRDACFNNHNDIISETVTRDGEVQARTYEYQYDLYGNWIERKMFISGKLKDLTIRKIKYK